MTTNEQMYFILGCVHAVATNLSKEINVPFEKCRAFLLNQVIKYYETNSTSLDMMDLIHYGIISDRQH